MPVGRSRGKKESVSGEDVVPTPAKRSQKKKQFPVVAMVTEEGIEGNLQQEMRRPLIAHLPIQSRDVIFYDGPIKYDPAPPQIVEPFDYTLDDPFTEQAATVLPISDGGNSIVSMPLPEQKEIIKKGPVTEDKVDYYKKGQILLQYKNSADIQKIPEKVDAACMWCCHTFDWRPCILPVRDEGKYLVVGGNFCTPQCVMAYLFDMRQDSHTRWEQVALLHRLYCEDPIVMKISPAPPRSVLKLFGGLYSIEEYREIVRQEKIRVDVHLPPMVSILSTLDTKPIDFYDVSLTKNAMDTMHERIKKAEEVVKLKRTKPLKAWENTLDACMNLKIVSAS